jgi:hypothetical protein
MIADPGASDRRVGSRIGSDAEPLARYAVGMT